MRALLLGVGLLALALLTIVWIARDAARVSSEPERWTGDTQTLESPELELAEPALVPVETPGVARTVVAVVPTQPARPPSFSLRGIVVDQNGVPVAGASLTILGPPRKRSNRPQRKGRSESATSDGNGAFLFSKLGAGSWRIDVRGDEISTLRRQVLVGPELGLVELVVERGDCLDIALHCEHGALGVLELDFDSRADTTARKMRGLSAQVCGLPSGLLRLRARSPDSSLQAVAEIEMPMRRHVKLWLCGPDGRLVTGRVLDSLGRHVPDARVVVAHRGPGGQEITGSNVQSLEIRNAVLDVPVLSDGTFTITLEPRHQWIGAFAEGYRIDYAELREDSVLGPFEFELQAR